MSIDDANWQTGQAALVLERNNVIYKKQAVKTTGCVCMQFSVYV